MTKALLTKAEKLRQEQSRARETVIKLNRKDGTEEGLTDEERSELNTAVDRLESIEPEIRSATAAEAAERAQLEEEAAKAGPAGLDPETRERNRLAASARLTNYVVAALSGKAINGPEAELRAALGMGEDAIPMAVADVPYREEQRAKAETRAATEAPDTVGVNMSMLQPFVFASSIASLLGIEIRTVPSGTYTMPRINTAPGGAASPKAKGAAVDSNAAQFVIKSATPKRIGARLTMQLEDVAAVGIDGFESSLRMALQEKLSDSFDDQVINGDDSGANLDGLLNQLGAATGANSESAGVETFDSWAGIAASVIDGLWARSLMQVGMVWNPEAYRQASKVFRGADGPISAASYLMRETAGFVTNKRMPDSASNVASGIAARLGQMGLARAVVPNWGRFAIDDIYSDSDKGIRHFTINAIVGDVILVQPDAYAHLGARVSS